VNASVKRKNPTAARMASMPTDDTTGVARFLIEEYGIRSSGPGL
jgi:hypothetical protein